MKTVAKNTTITLENSFHGTSVKVRVPQHWAEQGVDNAWGCIQHAALQSFDSSSPERRRLRRIELALCGVSGCKCGTVR